MEAGAYEPIRFYVCLRVQPRTCSRLTTVHRHLPTSSRIRAGIMGPKGDLVMNLRTERETAQLSSLLGCWFQTIH